MGRGRKPKTREEHIRNGSYKINPNRENKDQPEPTRERPPMPEVVASDPIAADKWEQLCKELEDMGIIATSDVDLLEVYCVLFSQYRSALDSVRKTGLVLVTREERGKSIEVKRNPFETVQFKIIAQLAKIMSELGLSPTARTRLAATPKTESDPFLEWLERSKN